MCKRGGGSLKGLLCYNEKREASFTSGESENFYVMIKLYGYMEQSGKKVRKVKFTYGEYIFVGAEF